MYSCMLLYTFLLLTSVTLRLKINMFDMIVCNCYI